MYAVFRESTYAPGRPIQEAPQFREFQAAHAKQPGYKGTIVTDVGAGRYLTMTLWEPQLLGTGQVVVNDLGAVRQG